MRKRRKASPVVVTRQERTGTPGEVVLTFGKYKGRRVDAIYAEDPDYVRWLANERKLRLRERSVDTRLLRMSEYAAKYLAHDGEQ